MPGRDRLGPDVGVEYPATRTTTGSSACASRSSARCRKRPAGRSSSAPLRSARAGRLRRRASVESFSVTSKVGRLYSSTRTRRAAAFERRRDPPGAERPPGGNRELARRRAEVVRRHGTAFDRLVVLVVERDRDRRPEKRTEAARAGVALVGEHLPEDLLERPIDAPVREDEGRGRRPLRRGRIASRRAFRCRRRGPRRGARRRSAPPIPARPESRARPVLRGRSRLRRSARSTSGFQRPFRTVIATPSSGRPVSPDSARTSIFWRPSAPGAPAVSTRTRSDRRNPAATTGNPRLAEKSESPEAATT